MLQTVILKVSILQFWTVVLMISDQIYSLGNVNDQVALIQENVRLLYDSCVPVRTKLVRAKHQPWFNAEIKALINSERKI